MKQIVPLSKTQLLIKKSLIALCIISGFLSLGLLWEYLHTKNSLKKSAQELAIKTTQESAGVIDQAMHTLAAIVNQFAHDLSSGKIEIKDLLEHLKKKSPTIYGLGVAFSPYAYSPEKKLYAPYVITQDDKSFLTSLESVLDYSAPDYTRFSSTLTTGAQFHEAFFDKASNSLIIEYSAPFYDKNNKPLGVVFGNYTLKYLQRKLESLYPSRFGYESIIANNGLYILHPNNEYITQKQTAPEIARQKKDILLAQNMEKAIKGELNFFNYKNLVSGQNSWIVFEPIRSTNWYLAGTFIIEEMVIPTQKLNRESILLYLALGAFFLFLLLVLMKIYFGSLNKLRMASAIFSLIIVSIVAAIWYREYMDVGKGTDQIIEKNVILEKLIHTYTTGRTESKLGLREEKKDSAALEKSIANIPLVPVGIYIHKLFIDITSISFVGYVWQKIPLNAQVDIPEGILFPQAQKCEMEQAYRMVHGNWKTIGWSVRCTLQQNFDYTNYPFDFQKIKIQLWPTTFENEIVFIPDLDSYKTINPTALPGVNSLITSQNWPLDRSFFSYAQEKRFTNFGYHSINSYNLIGRPSKLNLPELTFNIVVDRYALSSLILYLLPIIIILVLLFIVIVMAGHIRFSHMLASIASLFFTSLIAYTAFKSSLPIQKIVFFDYLYFIVQITILITSIISIIYYKKFNIRFINYNHMFIPQILFWPLISVAILITSLAFFY